MLTLDYHNAGGNGCAYVEWKGKQVEHFGCGGVTAQEMMDRGDGVELAKRCQHIESLGMTPSSNNVVWHWENFADCPIDSPYLPLLRYMPGYYERGEEIILTKGEFAVFVHGDTIEFVETKPDEITGWYHVLKANGFGLAQMGQGENLGTIYASYQQVKAWLDRHQINIEAVVNKIQEGLNNVRMERIVECDGA